MKKKSKNENGRRENGGIWAVCFTAAILILSLVALFSVLGNEVAKSLTPAGVSVGMCMIAVGSSLRSRQNETKGEKEDEKRG